ncbi:MAG TPA: M67 family metallopeptidase [Rhizomicrobium sp.]|nr:M67 family metallopeptidase [Rhizomicrobium sp.]
MTLTTLVMPDALGARISTEARAAFPRECCGLIEGVRTGDAIHAVAIHPVHNVSPHADSFEIDPAAHLRFRRIAREAGRAIVGCYHSHPNGRPSPSPRDLAGEADFVWLIAALDAHGAQSLAAFVPDTSRWHRIALEISARAA